jgi:hypothetical protein
MALKKKPRVLTARNADKYELYEAAVYEPEADLHFIKRLYRRARGHSPRVLREDFAGTSKLSALWAEHFPHGEAYAVDLDPEPLAWGRSRHIEPLGEVAKRIHQKCANVLTVRTPAADAVTAFNFSYWTFRERATMLAYHRHVYESLHRDGAFFLDLMGGPGIQEKIVEKRREKGFTYVWEQETTEAIQQHLRCHIHFRFPGGSTMRRAFTYDWRLWHVSELRDLLHEAGFQQVDVYWEDADARGLGTGVFRRRETADTEKAWIAYVVAWKRKARV